MQDQICNQYIQLVHSPQQNPTLSSMAKINHYPEPTHLWKVSVLLGVVQLILAFIIWGCNFGSKSGVRFELTLTVILLMLNCAVLQFMIIQKKYDAAAILSTNVAVSSLYLATFLICKVICSNINKPSETECTHVDHEQEAAVVAFALIEIIVSVLQTIVVSIVNKQGKMDINNVPNADFIMGHGSKEISDPQAAGMQPMKPDQEVIAHSSILIN